MLSQLPKITAKKKKRRGQGWASGAGKYSGRGVKGQKAKRVLPALFEGGQLPLSKKLPMLRGKSKNKPVKPQPLVINMSDLEQNAQVKNNAVITKEFLVQNRLINKTKAGRSPVKLLGRGVLTKKLKIEIPASKKAIEKIKQAGGEYTA